MAHILTNQQNNTDLPLSVLKKILQHAESGLSWACEDDNLNKLINDTNIPNTKHKNRFQVNVLNSDISKKYDEFSKDHETALQKVKDYKIESSLSHAEKILEIVKPLAETSEDANFLTEVFSSVIPHVKDNGIVTLDEVNSLLLNTVIVDLTECQSEIELSQFDDNARTWNKVRGNANVLFTPILEKWDSIVKQDRASSNPIIREEAYKLGIDTEGQSHLLLNHKAGDSKILRDRGLLPRNPFHFIHMGNKRCYLIIKNKLKSTNFEQILESRKDVPEHTVTGRVYTYRGGPDEKTPAPLPPIIEDFLLGKIYSDFIFVGASFNQLSFRDLLSFYGVSDKRLADLKREVIDIRNYLDTSIKHCTTAKNGVGAVAPLTMGVVQFKGGMSYHPEQLSFPMAAAFSKTGQNLYLYNILDCVLPPEEIKVIQMHKIAESINSKDRTWREHPELWTSAQVEKSKTQVFGQGNTFGGFKHIHLSVAVNDALTSNETHKVSQNTWDHSKPKSKKVKNAKANYGNSPPPFSPNEISLFGVKVDEELITREKLNKLSSVVDAAFDLSDGSPRMQGNIKEQIVDTIHLFKEPYGSIASLSKQQVAENQTRLFDHGSIRVVIFQIWTQLSQLQGQETVEMVVEELPALNEAHEAVEIVTQELPTLSVLSSNCPEKEAQLAQIRQILGVELNKDLCDYASNIGFPFGNQEQQYKNLDDLKKVTELLKGKYNMTNHSNLLFATSMDTLIPAIFSSDDTVKVKHFKPLFTQLRKDCQEGLEYAKEVADILLDPKGLYEEKAVDCLKKSYFLQYQDNDQINHTSIFSHFKPQPDHKYPVENSLTARVLQAQVYLDVKPSYLCLKLRSFTKHSQFYENLAKEQGYTERKRKAHCDKMTVKKRFKLDTRFGYTLPNRHYLHTRGKDLLHKAFTHEPPHISRTEFERLSVINQLDIDNVKADKISYRNWSEFDSRMEQLAALFYNGQYLTRTQYFARPETKQFYDFYGYMPWDLTFSTQISDENKLKYFGTTWGLKKENYLIPYKKY